MTKSGGVEIAQDDPTTKCLMIYWGVEVLLYLTGYSFFMLKIQENTQSDQSG